MRRTCYLHYKICKCMSPASLHWLAGDVKEPTHFSQRVGNVAPGGLKFLNLGYLQLSKRCEPPNAVWLKFPEKYCKLKKEICQECPKLASTIQSPKLATRVQNPQSAPRLQNPKSARISHWCPRCKIPHTCPKSKNRPLVSKIKHRLLESNNK